MLRFIILAGGLLAASPAAATATLTCDIEDTRVEFSLMGAVGSIPSFSINHAELELKAGAEWAPGKFEAAQITVAQRWILEPDLRLHLRVEPEGKTPEIDLVIVTKQKSEFDFAGTYRLTVVSGGKTVKKSGKAACGLG